MPANDVAVYAQWEDLWYLIEIDPNGGQFGFNAGMSSGDYSTWFWRKYHQTFDEYEGTYRDFIVSPTGTYYYRYTDRDHYGLDRDSDETGLAREAYYTTDISQATDLSQKYEYSPGAYRYAGWYRVFDDGHEELFNFATEVESDIYLRLHWKALGTYYIKYDPGEGKLDANDSNEEQFKILDDADHADNAQVVVTRTVEQPPAGKNFIGWKIKNDPDETIYYPGGTFDFNGALSEIEIQDDGTEKRYMVLEAVYQTVGTPSIIYDANGGTMTSEANHGTGHFLCNVTQDTNGQTVVTELTDQEKYTYDTAAGRLTVSSLVNNSVVQLSSGDGLSNGDYTFVGWNTKPDGTGTPFTKDSQWYIDTAEDDPITLYAMWELKVYFDKYNGEAIWSSNGVDKWDPPYQYDPDRGQYYIPVLLNAKLDEPPYIPTSNREDPVEMFQFWCPIRYTIYDEKEPFDFSQPITQALLDANASPLTLYAVWDVPLGIPVHAVDSSQEELVSKDDKWILEDKITINSDTHVAIGNDNTARTYADPDMTEFPDHDHDYAFAFACVSDKYENVSEEEAIEEVYYNKTARRIYARYQDGRDEPLPDNKEIYLVYYECPAKVPVNYVKMETNGTLTDTPVTDPQAPREADVNSAYAMDTHIDHPLSWANQAPGKNYKYYSYAIGDRNATDASGLHIITAPSNSDNDGARPSL